MGEVPASGKPDTALRFGLEIPEGLLQPTVKQS